VPGEALRTVLSHYAAAPGLLLKDWGGDQAVVFHPATNSTHLVNASAAAVLALLLNADPVQCGERAAGDDARGDDTLTGILDALSQVGLIRRIAD
jgi:hypothetical protein